MNKPRSVDVQDSGGPARTPGQRLGPVLPVLVLLLMPIPAAAQAPSPTDALAAVVEHLRDDSRIANNWYLGVDAVVASEHHPATAIDAASHREVLARIADARGLPYYSGEDFGRVICVASASPEGPPENCRFSHGTGSMLMLTIVTSDEIPGVTQVEVRSQVVGGASREEGELVTFRAGAIIALDVAYDAAGSPQVSEGRVPTLHWHGRGGVDEIQGGTLRR